MVLGPAGNVAVHVAIQLEAPRDAGVDERLERAEDGGAPERGSPRRPIVDLAP